MHYHPPENFRGDKGITRSKTRFITSYTKVFIKKQEATAFFSSVSAIFRDSKNSRGLLKAMELAIVSIQKK